MIPKIPTLSNTLNLMKKISIGELKIETPIIQGGMGIGVSLSGLALAVANEGGVGTISAVAPGFREPDFITNFREANMRAPARVKTKFVKEIMDGQKKPISRNYKCLHTCDYHNVQFCIAQALINAQSGLIDEGVCCSGVNGYLNNEIISVHELIKTIKREYSEAESK